MSLPDRLRPLRGFAFVVLLPLVLAGCIRPMYGEAAGGGSVQQKLSGIVVDQVPDRLGHYLVQELRFDLDGSGASTKPLYRLSIQVDESVNSAIVSSVTGRAVSAVVNANAAFTLKKVGTDETVLSGRASASASYDRTSQRFESVRAARDAEMRIARQLSDQIRTRIATHFATRT